MDEPQYAGKVGSGGIAGSGSIVGGPRLVEDRYAEVPGALERLSNQVASVEVAAHELAGRLGPILRLDTPQPSREVGPDMAPSSGVDVADTITSLADRVASIDGFLRNLEGRVAL